MPFDIQPLIPSYQDAIDNIIDQLGKYVKFIYPPTVSSITDSSQDVIRDDSRYPDFKGEAPTVTENSEEIKCLIKWNPKELSDYGVNVAGGTNTIRLKTYLVHAPKLYKAEFMIPNIDSEAFVNQKFKMVIAPIPVGLGEDRYCISYWKQI